jgi:hypothetical protein
MHFEPRAQSAARAQCTPRTCMNDTQLCQQREDWWCMHAHGRPHNIDGQSAPTSSHSAQTVCSDEFTQCSDCLLRRVHTVLRCIEAGILHALLKSQYKRPCRCRCVPLSRGSLPRSVGVHPRARLARALLTDVRVVVIVHCCCLVNAS